MVLGSAWLPAEPLPNPPTAGAAPASETHASFLSPLYATGSAGLIFVSVLASITSLTGCSTKDNPDEIRQRTAEETATMKRDAKAAPEGVKEGVGRDKDLK